MFASLCKFLFEERLRIVSATEISILLLLKTPSFITNNLFSMPFKKKDKISRKSYPIIINYDDKISFPNKDKFWF